MVLRVQYFRNDMGSNFWEIIDTYAYVTVAEAFTKDEAIKKAHRYSLENFDGAVDVEILNTDGSYNRTEKVKGRKNRGGA